MRVRFIHPASPSRRPRVTPPWIVFSLILLCLGLAVIGMLLRTSHETGLPVFAAENFRSVRVVLSLAGMGLFVAWAAFSAWQIRRRGGRIPE